MPTQFAGAASVHFTISPPEGVSLDLGPSNASQLAVSPDGRSVVFVGVQMDGRTRLWLRPIDQEAPIALQGTDGATYQFWSPDGTTIAFFAIGKLKKVGLGGAPSQIIADTSGAGSGGVWASDDTLLYSTLYGPMWRVAASGGTPAKVAQFADTGVANRFPSLLPGGRRLV
jgi:Tol biopolymer transport system component